MNLRSAIVYILTILLHTSLFAQHGALVGDRTVVFYPENFRPSETLPSMALSEEPDSLGEVPPEWSITPSFYLLDGKNSASIDIEEGTDLYGTGEVIGDLRRNDTEVIFWNTDNYGYWKEDGKRLYQSHPWILAVRQDGTSYGILADHTWKQQFTLEDPVTMVSEGPPFRIIIVERNSPQEVMMALGQLTGTIELPPLWALGYHQCRYSYFPASEVIEIAQTFREKEIPCDVIWMDIDYMDGYRVFTFDPSGFPDPTAVNDELHEMDFHSIWMIDPGIKQDNGYFVYDEGTSGDHWVKRSNNSTYFGDVWPGSCAFPDFTRPETRQWWAGLYQNFMSTGIDGVWNDMNEPAVFNVETGTMPKNNKHRGGGGLPADIHLRYHNIYGMLMVKATREGILQANPGKRPFVLTRANFLGGHRYAATWTGDNQSSWEHMKMSIPMSLNLGLSGQPFSGPDIGGFIGNPGPELLGQWMALGAFYPFSRNHTSTDTGPQEPWVHGQVIEDVSRLALQRRYRLLPYLYTLFRESSETGLPVMRPAFFADIADPALRQQQEVFLWGSDLLIIPSWAAKKDLPSGRWRNIFPIDEQQETDNYQPLLKQREGSVLPLAEIAQSTETYSHDSITLLIALNESREATGTLYADAGDGFAHQTGEYLETAFSVSPVDGEDSLLVSCLRISGNLTGADRSYQTGLVTNHGIYYSDWKQNPIFKIPFQPDLFVELLSPYDGEEFETDATIPMTAVSEGELVAESIQFYANDLWIGEAVDTPWSFLWEDAAPGLYTIHATGITPSGIEVTTDDINIHIGEPGTGSITYEVWRDIGDGAFVSDLTSLPDYPNLPDERSELDRFQTPENNGEEFGARLIGYLHPPITGNYTFLVSGDDYCDLWLSSDANPANKSRIAQVPGWTSPGEWEKYSQQRSVEIMLEAGQKYFIMGLHKESHDNDHLAAAWEYEGQIRQIIPGTFLSPYDILTGSAASFMTNDALISFPNPVSHSITIQHRGIPGLLSIYTTAGALVQESVVTGLTENTVLDVSMVPPGTYILKLQNSSGSSSHKITIAR